ncbi:MAG: LysM peptidoglycan-binding domain-containing protein [Anaerolineaceae bacterium]|nr:LysM peptidoglycan-binding domain-containing protein [Anaerolineaceae bacterium]
MQKLRSSIILMMMLIAIILAVGVFLAINAVQNRSNNPETVPDLTASNFLVTVSGETVALQVDPNLRPTVIDNPAPVVVEESPRVEEPVDQQVSTATPEPTLPPAIVEQATAVPAAPATVEKIIYQPYTVQQGDTLYSLSQAFATSIALMADKGISQASLVPGTTINIPVGNPEYCAGRGRPYAVGEGDTAFNIGQRFNTTPQNLQALNGLDANYTIKIADIICVP